MLKQNIKDSGRKACLCLWGETTVVKDIRDKKGSKQDYRKRKLTGM